MWVRLSWICRISFGQARAQILQFWEEFFFKMTLAAKNRSFSFKFALVNKRLRCVGTGRIIYLDIFRGFNSWPTYGFELKELDRRELKKKHFWFSWPVYHEISFDLSLELFTTWNKNKKLSNLKLFGRMLETCQDFFSTIVSFSRIGDFF